MLLSRHAAVQVSERALAQADPKAALRAVMKSWLPLSEAVLGMAVEQLPDPISAAPERLPRLLALAALDGMASPLSPSVRQVTAAAAVLSVTNPLLPHDIGTPFLQRNVVCKSICKIISEVVRQYLLKCLILTLEMALAVSRTSSCPRPHISR